MPVGIARPERIALSQDSRYLKLCLQRTLGGRFLSEDNIPVTLKVTKDNSTFSMTSVAYSKGTAFFDVRSNAQFAKRGLYKAVMLIEGCEYDRIEIVNAPSYYIHDAEVTLGDCDDGAWVEPPCIQEPCHPPVAPCEPLTGTCNTPNECNDHNRQVCKPLKVTRGYGI